MTTTTTVHPRELAHRCDNAIEIALLWNPWDDALTVTVIDHRTGDAFVLDVDRRRALEAFHHPFAYAEPRRDAGRAQDAAVRTAAPA